MALRVFADDKSGIYHVHGTVAGQRIRRSLGTRDGRLAREKAAAIEAAIWRRGEYGSSVRAFEEAVIGYLKDGGEARFMEPVLRHLRGKRLDQITPAMIREGAMLWYPDAAGATRNRQFIAPAAAVINWAHNEWGTPPIKARRFPEPAPQRVAVDQAWMGAFMSAASPHLGALYLFMHLTGARIGESVGLRWADVDLRSGTARLAKTKNGDSRVCHLTADLMEAIAALPQDDRPVFRYASRRHVYPAAKKACARAGLTYVPPHQAGRHSYATALDGLGFTEAQIAEAGGWKSTRMPGRYVHVDNAGKAAAEALGRHRTKR